MPKTQITIPIFIPHLGCPHRCIFCNQWETSSTRTIPDRNHVINKINLFLSKIKQSVERIEVAFFGGSFTAIDYEEQKKLLEAAFAFKKRGNLHDIRISTRPDCIDKECLQFLKRYEVNTIELGVQSFSNKVLTASGRGHTSVDVFNAIKLIKQFKFNFVIQLMPGLPDDTEEESIRSAEISSMFNPSAIRIYPALVLNKTRLAEIYHSNEYKPLSLETAVELCKKMFLLFQKNGIPVIRMGLHPFSQEEIHNIIDGPYHPSFGFLVKSRLKRDIMENKINEILSNTFNSSINSIEIAIPFREKEEFIGNKKENISYLKRLYNNIEIDYNINKEDDLEIKVS